MESDTNFKVIFYSFENKETINMDFFKFHFFGKQMKGFKLLLFL